MKNFKKLNKKGFTLVELLAIIVILAIILVVTVPAVFSAIDNSRKMSLENSAKGLAKWINDTVVAEQIQTDNAEPLAGQLSGVTTAWSCITQSRIIAEMSQNDYLIDDADGTAPLGATGPGAAAVTNTPTCSAIRYNGSTYEVLLIAAEGGKLYTASAAANNIMWATSTNLNSWPASGE